MSKRQSLISYSISPLVLSLMYGFRQSFSDSLKEGNIMHKQFSKNVMNINENYQ